MVRKTLCMGLSVLSILAAGCGLGRPAPVAIIGLHNPAVRGRLEAVKARTRPGLTCHASVVYNAYLQTPQPSAVEYSQDLAQPKVADSQGDVLWTWIVDRTAPTGDAVVMVQCGSGVDEHPFRVV